MARIKAGGEWHPMSAEEGPGEVRRTPSPAAHTGSPPAHDPSSATNRERPGESNRARGGSVPETATPPTPIQSSAEAGPREPKRAPSPIREKHLTLPTPYQCRATMRNGQRCRATTTLEVSLCPFHALVASSVSAWGCFLERRTSSEATFSSSQPEVIRKRKWYDYWVEVSFKEGLKKWLPARSSLV